MTYAYANIDDKLMSLLNWKLFLSKDNVDRISRCIICNLIFIFAMAIVSADIDWVSDVTQLVLPINKGKSGLVICCLHSLH